MNTSFKFDVDNEERVFGVGTVLAFFELAFSNVMIFSLFKMHIKIR
jgi:hypothetical protein